MRATFALAAGLALLPADGMGQAVVEVQVAPVTVTLDVGERRDLLASAYDARGDNIATARFYWTSSNPGVVRIEEDPSVPGMAVLIGLAPGIASVEARIGDRRGSAAVQVTAEGRGRSGRSPGVGVPTVLQIEPGSVFLLPSEDLQLSPVFLKHDGSPAAWLPVRWRSLRSDVAAVTPEGTIVAVSPGQGVVEASTGTGLLARVTVQVELAAFRFASDALMLSPGQKDTIRTTIPQQNHRVLSPRRLVWRSTNPAVVRVSPLGVATGVGQGEAQIVASGFGQESKLPVVVHRPVDVLEVVPMASAGPIGVPLGGTRVFSVKALASDESPVPEAPLRWRISNPTVAALDPQTGVVTGKALGRAELTVRAPGEGLEVTWGIDVVAGGVALEVDALGLRLGERRALRASFLDTRGVPVSEATGIEWTSTDQQVLTIDDGGNLVPVALGAASVIATTPWGAADTARVYVQGEVLLTSTRNGNADLFTFQLDRPGVFHQLTATPAGELSGEVSPDGTKMVYVSDEGPSLDIYLADADGGNPVALTSSTGQEGAPTWTPDGRHILYESDTGGAIQIWRMAADGADKRQLTDGDSPNLQPAVSPDGGTIAFTSTRGGNYDIYLMNLDGSDQRSFTTTPGNETRPAWIGNGALAFIVESRSRKTITRAVIRMELQRQTTRLTPEGLAITDFAVSPTGDHLAAVVTVKGRKKRVERRLYLVPLSGPGMPVEVPRASDSDQLTAPSFRR